MMKPIESGITFGGSAMCESSRRIIQTGSFATGCAISSRRFTLRSQNDLSADCTDLHRFPVWLLSRVKQFTSRGGRNLSNRCPAFLIKKVICGNRDPRESAEDKR